MEIKISEELRAIINFARQEAMRTGHHEISQDHLFLSILRHEDNDACRTLQTLGVDLGKFKQFIDTKVFTKENVLYSEIENISFSRNAQNALSFTVIEATRARCLTAYPQHLLLALMSLATSYGAKYLQDTGLSYAFVRDSLKEQGLLKDDGRPEDESGEQAGAREEGQTWEDSARRRGDEDPSPLDEFGFDLTKAAAQGKIDPVVGRSSEMERVIQILLRRKKNNPMLVGDPGVGKSAIVEGIAMRIAAGDIPEDLRGKRIVSLDVASVVAGTRYRGDFEKRMKGIIKQLTESPDIILFIDEFHTLVGAGSASGSLDAANLMKPALARGEIRCIGATTFDEFSKIVEKDGALDRRFQKVAVSPTDIPQTVAILNRIKSNYESHHHVSYTPEAIEGCAKMSDKYITDRCLPDKAIDVLDEAGSMVHLRASAKKGEETVEVTSADIAAVISKMTGVPAGRMTESDNSRLVGMGDFIKSRIIGQDDAVETIVRAIRRNYAGIKDPRRPIGTFLFVGPTGVGKTQLAKVLAECLFDSEDNLIRMDMSEYMEKFNVSRLIGAPPGYVGYEEGGQLSEKVRRHPYSVILLDEIEKAHSDVFNLLLQIIDEGRLTDSNGRMVNFRNTVLIMTSNAGSRDREEYGGGLGFSTAATDLDATRKAIVEKSISRLFPPEFLGRVDARVFFDPLSQDDISKIIDIELRELAARMSEQGFRLQVTPAAKKLVASAGYDAKFGARPLKRAIGKYIEDPAAEYIISQKMLIGGNVPDGVILRIGLTRDRRSTCVISGTKDIPTEELDKLYIDNFEAHLVNHVDECAQ